MDFLIPLPPQKHSEVDFAIIGLPLLYKGARDWSRNKVLESALATKSYIRGKMGSDSSWKRELSLPMPSPSREGSDPIFPSVKYFRKIQGPLPQIEMGAAYRRDCSIECVTLIAASGKRSGCQIEKENLYEKESNQWSMTNQR